MPLSFRGTSRFVRLTSRHFTSPPIWLVPLHTTSPCLPFCPPHFTPLRVASLLSASLHATSCHFASPPVLSASLRATSRHFASPPVLSASLRATSCHFASPPVLSASLRATSLYFASPPFFQPRFNSPHLISPVRPPDRRPARPPARFASASLAMLPPKKYGFFRKRPIKQKPQPVSPIPP